MHILHQNHSRKAVKAAKIMLVEWGLCWNQIFLQLFWWVSRDSALLCFCIFWLWVKGTKAGERERKTKTGGQPNLSAFEFKIEYSSFQYIWILSYTWDGIYVLGWQVSLREDFDWRERDKQVLKCWVIFILALLSEI